ncbi:MAG TPA: 5'-nucleotidase C-terminal domain-containing protein [Chloroflexota bacterium]|nr:5'-nucleotidase C-terminal domain-containing protein [Chloroflexota bacterium]
MITSSRPRFARNRLRAASLGLGLISLLTISGLGSAAPSARAVDARDAGIALTIMHFNDDYELTPTSSLGGMEYLAGQIDQVRQQDPKALLLFAGDVLSPSVESSVFLGGQMIAAFNRLGVTAATFGNHEFDRGDAPLAQRIDSSHFPWLSSNVIVTASGKPFPGAVSTKLVTAHGVKVGLLGLLTQDTYALSKPGPELTIQPVISAARTAVNSLLAQGATVIVAVTHQDMSADIALATALPRIDLIVGGHDHLRWEATVGHTLITKSESDAHYLGVATVNVGANGRVTSMLEQDLTIDPTVTTPDPAMAKLVKGYESQLSKNLNVVIGRTTVPLDAREITIRQKESALGDYIADAMRAATGTDIAITNSGGIRTDAITPAGPITRKTILSFLPFGDLLVTEKVTGAQVWAALDNGVSQVADGAGRFPQVSGLTFTWKLSRPAAHRVTSVTIGGQPISLTQTYTLATNDYMLGGGDGYTALSQGTTIVGPTGATLLATVVIAAVKKDGTISPVTDGRDSETR